jgi:hypothetical protein
LVLAAVLALLILAGTVLVALNAHGQRSADRRPCCVGAHTHRAVVSCAWSSTHRSDDGVLDSNGAGFGERRAALLVEQHPGRVGRHRPPR